VAPSFATIVSPDYIVLVLDQNSTSFEIVWLTAYTSGSLNGTILRAQEGTSALAHTAATSSWGCNPTLQDIVTANDLISVSNLSPLVSQNVPAGYGAVFPGFYEINSGLTTEIGSGGYLEIT
jgi:hypothetical protein